MSRNKRIAINTGGGDAPGLNAVIRAVVLSAKERGWDVVGIKNGYHGLLNPDKTVPLDRDSVRGIAHLGGTILGTSNRGNPFEYPENPDDDRTEVADRSDDVLFRSGSGGSARDAVGDDFVGPNAHTRRDVSADRRGVRW